MRFSLRTLMLFFPAIVIAWMLSAFLNSFDQQFQHPKWIHERTKLTSLHAATICIWVETGRPVEVAKINDWFAGKIAYTDPNYRELAHVLAPYQMNDLYQQPYRCVALDENQQPLPQVERSARVGIYSLGEDGRSVTGGSDPDDLNSWELIHQHHFDKLRNQRLWEVAMWFPFVFSLVLFVGRRLFGKSQTKSSTNDHSTARLTNDAV